jgi:radical SAM superfamily enzyme YgiQ (UPF0313 family)
MNALLVYPIFPDSYWSFRHALGMENRRSAFPPLGLMTIAAMMPRSWRRRLVDMNVQALRARDIAWADVVFVSAMRIQGASMARVIRQCNELGKRVVVGGPYVSSTPEAAADADHVFIGEAEATFPEFVRDETAGAARRVYEAPERPDVTTSPVPEFALASLHQYLAMPLQYSRGCPFRCEFCDIIELYGRVPRTKTNEQVLAELDALYRTGRRGAVFIVDDNFIGNKRNVRTLLPHLGEWSRRHGRPFSFATEASINLADDDELLASMREAGFRRVFIGIESPDEGSLKEAQKSQNTKRDLLDGIRKVQAYGMEVMGGFIVGFDNDPDNIFDQQIDFIRAAAIPLAMVGILTAAPHTQLWRRLEREGRLLNGFTGNNTDGSLNFIPKMEPNRLVEGYQRIVRTLYAPGEYYRRALASISRIGAAVPERVGGGFFERLAALGRTLITLGIRDRHRGEFWRFLGQVLRQRHEQFPQALVLAAMGYHFRKLTDALAANGAPVQVGAQQSVASQNGSLVASSQQFLPDFAVAADG